MKLDLNNLGYRWKGIYSPFLSYLDNDVVFLNGDACVMRNGAPQPFALGQQDATLRGHLLTGDISVGGIGGMVLHSNGAAGVEFRFMEDRNGTVATALMQRSPTNTGYVASNHYMSSVMTDGSVRTWGRQEGGQGGSGNSGAIARTFPSRVAFPPGTGRIVDVKTCQTQTLFLDVNGMVWTTGANIDNRAGIGAASGIPVRVNGYGDLGSTTRVTKIFTGFDYYGFGVCAALDEAGRVYMWGSNRYNCQGNGAPDSNPVPRISVISLRYPIKDVFISGGYHAATWLLDTSGRLWAKGENHTTGLESADPVGNNEHKLFMPWGEDKPVKSVVAHESHNHVDVSSSYYRSYCVVLENGSLFGWGHDSGQVSGGWGTGFRGDIWRSTNAALFPYKMSDGVEQVVMRNGGYHTTVALMKDGTVIATGADNYGQAGGGGDTANWRTIGGSFLTGVKKIGIWGGQYGATLCALRSDGQAVVWGQNFSGQQGNGSFLAADAGTPPNDFVRIDKRIVDFSAAGYTHGGTQDLALYFLTEDGQVMATGSGGNAKVGDDDEESRAIPSPIQF